MPFTPHSLNQVADHSLVAAFHYISHLLPLLVVGGFFDFVSNLFTSEEEIQRRKRKAAHIEREAREQEARVAAASAEQRKKKQEKLRQEREAETQKAAEFRKKAETEAQRQAQEIRKAEQLEQAKLLERLRQKEYNDPFDFFEEGHGSWENMKAYHDEIERASNLTGEMDASREYEDAFDLFADAENDERDLVLEEKIGNFYGEMEAAREIKARRSTQSQALKEVNADRTGLKGGLFITISNSRRLTQNIELDYQTALGEVYHKPVYYLNRLEKANLLLYKELCQDPERFSQRQTKVAKFGDLLLDTSTPPAFHSDQNCEFAHSSYKNYEIPEEVKKAGREGEFRQWFAAKLEENPAFLDRGRLSEALLLQCKERFGLQLLPKELLKANSGVEAFTRNSKSDAEKAIDQLLDSIARYAKTDNNHRFVLDKSGTHAYLTLKPKLSAAEKENISPSGVDFRVAKEILFVFENDYKRPLLSALREYYRIAYNARLMFDASFLQKFGFKPCRNCFPNGYKEEDGLRPR